MKAYVEEAGSAWVERATAGGSRNACFVARICSVEIVSGVARRARTGEIPAEDVRGITAKLKQDLLDDYYAVELSGEIIDRAIAAAEKHALRAYDAIQLGAALHVRDTLAGIQADSLTFVSSDLPLNAAARAEGLAVIDPNHAPA